MNVKLLVVGIEAFKAAARNKAKRVHEEVQRQVIESTIRIESDAKQFAPVDTGRLRSSIKREIRDEAGRVYTDVEYAPYVEFGTSSTPAQPYMQPAVEAERKRIPKEFRKYLNDVIQE